MGVILCAVSFLCCWFAVNVILDGMDIVEEELNNYDINS